MGSYLGGDFLAFATSLLDQGQPTGSGEVGDMGVNLKGTASFEYRSDRLELRFAERSGGLLGAGRASRGGTERLEDQQRECHRDRGDGTGSW